MSEGIEVPKGPKPKVWLWHDDTGWSGGDQVWRAIKEDGTDMGWHVSSHRMYGVNDMKAKLNEAALEILVLGPGEWPPDEVLVKGGWEPNAPEPEPDIEADAAQQPEQADPTLLGEGEEIWLHGEVGEDGGLLFEFDTDSDVFARGFEAGKFWFQCAVRPTAFVAQVHPSNSLMVRRMCAARGRNVMTEKVSDQILEVQVGPLPERPAGRMPVPMPEPPTAPPEL